MFKRMGIIDEKEDLSRMPTKIDAAAVLLRLKNKESEALSFSGQSNFSDSLKTPQYENIMAYLKNHPELGMQGNENMEFEPLKMISLQEYVKILLGALNYCWIGLFGRCYCAFKRNNSIVNITIPVRIHVSYCREHAINTGFFKNRYWLANRFPVAV